MELNPPPRYDDLYLEFVRHMYEEEHSMDVVTQTITTDLDHLPSTGHVHKWRTIDESQQCAMPMCQAIATVTRGPSTDWYNPPTPDEDYYPNPEYTHIFEGELYIGKVSNEDPLHKYTGAGLREELDQWYKRAVFDAEGNITYYEKPVHPNSSENVRRMWERIREARQTRCKFHGCGMLCHKDRPLSWSRNSVHNCTCSGCVVNNRRISHSGT